MEQTYSSEEIRQLLLYVKEMNEINEELRAGIILMQAKLDNEEAKVKRLTNFINQFTNVN
jgi:FMN-dependent NADH-azoreductase